MMWETHLAGFNREKDIGCAQLSASLVAYGLGIDYEAIMGDERGGTGAAFARQIAMYMMHVALSISLARVAYAFGRDRSTVSHGCRIVEERREDSDFDAWLHQLEAGLESVAPAHTSKKEVA